MKTQQETLKTLTEYKEKFTKAAKGKSKSCHSEHSNVRDGPMDIWEGRLGFFFMTSYFSLCLNNKLFSFRSNKIFYSYRFLYLLLLKQLYVVCLHT